jgi:hypothetical protein
MLVERRGDMYVRVSTILARQYGFPDSGEFRRFLAGSKTIRTVVERQRPNDEQDRKTWMYARFRDLTRQRGEAPALLAPRQSGARDDA